MSPRKRPRKRPRKNKRKQERVEDEERAEDERADDEEGEEERLSSGQRYALLVSVLVILGVGVIFIDVILAWVMGLLGRS